MIKPKFYNYVQLFEPVNTRVKDAIFRNFQKIYRDIDVYSPVFNGNVKTNRLIKKKSNATKI